MRVGAEFSCPSIDGGSPRWVFPELRPASASGLTGATLATTRGPAPLGNGLRSISGRPARNRPESLFDRREGVWGGLLQLAKRGVVAAANLKPTHQLRQLRSLLRKRMARRRRLLDHRCVLLGHLIHLINRGVDLRQPRRLLSRPRRDLADDDVDLAHL